MPLKSKLKNYNCPSTNIMRMNRAICMIPEICQETFPWSFGDPPESLDRRLCTNQWTG